MIKVTDNGRYFTAPPNVTFDKRELLKNFIEHMSNYFPKEKIWGKIDNIPAKDFVNFQTVFACVDKIPEDSYTKDNYVIYDKRGTLPGYSIYKIDTSHYRITENKIQIFKELLFDKYPWFKYLKPDVYQDLDEFYVNGIYIPTKALNGDYTIISKRMVTYFKEYYKNKKEKYVETIKEKLGSKEFQIIKKGLQGILTEQDIQPYKEEYYKTLIDKTNKKLTKLLNKTEESIKEIIDKTPEIRIEYKLYAKVSLKDV